MGRCGFIFAVVAATCVAIGCGSTAVENPAAPSSVTPSPTPSPSPSPSPQIPSLLGEWRGTGTLELTRADGSRFGLHGCPSFWTVQSQDGGNFSGLVSIGGNGRTSDRLCGYTGRFSGTITADGAMTIRLTPHFTQGCSRVAGDSTFTGTRQTDGTIGIETSAAATCRNNTDQFETGTRTVTFPWVRPTR